MAFSFTRARGMSVPAIPSFRTLISPAASPTRPTADSQPTSPSHLKWSSIDLTEEEDEDCDHDLYSRTSSFHTPTTSALSSPTTSPGSGPYKTLSPEDKNMSSTDSGLSSRRSQYDDAVDPTADLGGESHDLESDLPDVDALPQEVSRLHDIIRANRTALEKRNAALAAAHDRLEKLSRSHDDLLERSSQWKDELEMLQANHAAVQQQLSTSKADNEGLGEQIKDLRYRSEESRRAILRLQGERKTTGGGSGVAGDRRSVAAGSLAGWNPSLLQGDANASGSSSEDAAAAKSSKRSTILFGAPSAAAQRRHARTGSSSNVVASPTPSEAGQETERTPQQTSASSIGGGLRGLRLGFDRRPSGEGEEKEGEAATAASSPSVPLTRRSLLLPPGGNSTSRPPSTQSVSPTPSASGSGLGSPLMGDGQFLPLPSSPALSASGDSDIPTARPTQTFATAGAGMSAMQIVRLKDDELAKMQGELKALRAKLDEAIEGRRASDACLKALKEFIGEGGPEGEEAARAALRGVKLPPLPTDDDEETIDAGPGARPNGAAADSWWTSVMRKASAAQPTATGGKRVGSSTTAPSTGGAPSEVLSTSPSNLSTTSGRQSTMDESSPHPSSSSFASAAAPSTSGGLASFGSFFTRTASTSPQPPQPPSKSPEQQRQELGRSVSGGSGTSETSGSGVNASPRRPLNRLSTWFSKPTPATPGETTSSALPTVASPPFASLEESTLHRVDLSATPRKSSASALGGGGGGGDASSMNNGMGSGMGLGLVGAGAGAAVGVSPSDEAGPPAPPHKEVPLSARAAKADARVADVGEDGLDGGPLVAPTFD